MVARNAIVLIGGELKELPSGDTLNGATGSSGGPGGGVWVNTVIDFGEIPKYSGRFTLNDANAHPGSTAFVKYISGTDDAEFDGILLAATCAVEGQIDVTAHAVPGPISGTVQIRYMIYAAPSGGGGGAISILDEGDLVSASPSSINFRGANVSAWNNGADVYVDIAPPLGFREQGFWVGNFQVLGFSGSGVNFSEPSAGELQVNIDAAPITSSLPGLTQVPFIGTFRRYLTKASRIFSVWSVCVSEPPATEATVTLRVDGAAALTLVIGPTQTYAYEAISLAVNNFSYITLDVTGSNVTNLLMEIA